MVEAVGRDPASGLALNARGVAAKVAAANSSHVFVAVPLYELVLRYPDREEVRLTDQPLTVGETFQIDYEEWFVAEKDDRPENPRASARLICDLAVSQRAKAAKVQADDAERRRRMTDVEPRAPKQRRRSGS